MTLRQHRQHGLEKTVAYLNERIKTLDALGNRYAWYRLITFLVGFGVGIPLYWVSEFAFWVIIISTIILFNIVAYQHRRVESSHKKHQIWLDIKSTQLARMRLDWDSIPQTSFRSDNFDHPFEADLDITGKKSIHQLINLAISHEGGELLRNWLLQQSPDLADIQQRQPVVKELSALSGFRDKLLLNFKWVSEEQLEGKKLLDWLKQPSASSALKWVLPLSTVLAIVNIGLFILYWVIQLSPFWVITLSIYVIIFFMNQGITKHLFKNATLLDEEFGKIKAIIKFLETYPYHKSSHLAGKCHPFWEATQSPSRYLKRMKRIVAAIGFRGNPLVWLLINLIGPYDFFLARSLNRYKSALKDRLPQWIHTWTELEALISLANMAWLNPQYSFPQVYANKQSPSDAILSAKQL
nr:hypothetical protein [candidate division Zixibacteria bacterium]NIT57553.1 hypothetical protein [Fodinibius sp.]NIU14381.1 hypothetical protein [candidate division Zixibacteria bacterium]NIV06444.1 hypothetical protein [candidate division Zixibacteria bacterium]NIY26135.1 hypothetical protein [Fodinibius sp.]